MDPSPVIAKKLLAVLAAPAMFFSLAIVAMVMPQIQALVDRLKQKDV